MRTGESTDGRRSEKAVMVTFNVWSALLARTKRMIRGLERLLLRALPKEIWALRKSSQAAHYVMRSSGGLTFSTSEIALCRKLGTAKETEVHDSPGERRQGVDS